MTTYDRLVDVALVALISACVTAAAVLAVRFDVEPADTLGFFGALIGAAAAVWGAIEVDRRRAKQLASAERAAILASADGVAPRIAKVAEASHALMISGDEDEYLHPLVSTAIDGSEAIARFITVAREGLDRAASLSFLERADLRTAMDACERLGETLGDMIRAGREDVPFLPKDTFFAASEAEDQIRTLRAAISAARRLG